MSTIYILIAGVIAVLLILGSLPGIKHLIQPLIGGVSVVFSVFFGHLAMWIIWLVKAIYRAHEQYFRHLVSPRKKIDPTQSLNKK